MNDRTISTRLDALLFATLLDPERSATLCSLLAGDTLATAHLDDEALAGLLEATPSERTLAHAVTCHECQRSMLAVEEAISVVPLPQEAAPTRLAAAQPRALFARVCMRRGSPTLLGGSGHHRVAPSLSTRNQATSNAGLTMRDQAESPLWQLTLSTVDAGARWSVDTQWLGHDPPRTIRVLQSQRLVAEVPILDARATLPRLRPIDTRIEFVNDGEPVAVTWIAVERA
ncbi:MAG: hypothetical protein ACI81R_003842 [Bradymonadia bacterium]|jgi:hypothetical protein